MSDEPLRFAIIWSRGDEVYTHSDENGNTVTYIRDDLESLVGLSPQRIFTELDSLSAIKQNQYALHAVPVEILDRLLGVNE